MAFFMLCMFFPTSDFIFCLRQERWSYFSTNTLVS